MIVRTLLIAAVAGLTTACGEAPRAETAPPTPPFAMSDSAVSATSADGTYAARWEPEGGALPDAEPFSARFALRRADGRAISPDARFTVDAEMPEHGHGMNLVPSVSRVGKAGADELLVASGMLLHMTGRWVLSLDVEEDGVLERTQWFVDVK